jgi:hypothetical protein
LSSGRSGSRHLVYRKKRVETISLLEEPSGGRTLRPVAAWWERVETLCILIENQFDKLDLHFDSHGFTHY